MTEIASLAGFSFLLIIICVGYVFVETLSSSFPSLLRHLHRHTDGMLERLILYIISGVVINYMFILVLTFGNGLANIGNMLNSAGEIGKSLGYNTTTSLNIQMFSFSILYFIVVMMVAWMMARIPTFFLPQKALKK